MYIIVLFNWLVIPHLYIRVSANPVYIYLLIVLVWWDPLVHPILKGMPSIMVNAHENVPSLWNVPLLCCVSVPYVLWKDNGINGYFSFIRKASAFTFSVCLFVLCLSVVLCLSFNVCLLLISYSVKSAPPVATAHFRSSSGVRIRTLLW